VALALPLPPFFVLTIKYHTQMPYKLLNKKKDKEILLSCRVALVIDEDNAIEGDTPSEVDLGKKLKIVEAVLNIKRSDVYALKSCDLEILDDEENFNLVEAAIIEFWDGRKEFVEMPLRELYDVIFVDKTDVN